MSVNVIRLNLELTAASLDVGVGIVSNVYSTERPSTFIQRPNELVCLTWTSYTPTAAQVSQATAIVLAHDGSASADLPMLRQQAVALLPTSDSTYRIVRSVVCTTVDEINLLREWITSFKAAVAAATSLAE